VQHHFVRYNIDYKYDPVREDLVLQIPSGRGVL